MADTRVVYLELGKNTVDHNTLLEIKPHQVLIKIHQASICGSERVRKDAGSDG
jgi:threonine dehydrogenase-like Zn-dependent dehydrogenase